MELTQQAIDQVQQAVSHEIDAQGAELFLPAGVSSDALCANKDLIMGFLTTLTGLLPGVVGKIAGQVVTAAAGAWFAKKCRE